MAEFNDDWNHRIRAREDHAPEGKALPRGRAGCWCDVGIADVRVVTMHVTLHQKVTKISLCFVFLRVKLETVWIIFKLGMYSALLIYCKYFWVDAFDL